MQELSQDDSSTPPIYQSKAQSWIRRLHTTADLGYAGLFPSHPGQEEGLLSVRAVKYGFTTESRVSAEAFSAKSVIEGFHSNEVFLKLEEMMNELFVRRSEALPAIPPATFRLPARVTLNETKRRSWFRDLANPDVPLHKLGKSVPHGAKGHDLLDLLHTNNVAIPRAVWFLRVFGANEVAGLRNKPSYNPKQYSIDWANVVTGYMKKQLHDIALPSPPRAGLNIKQTFKGVLTDIETRERWVSRFSYCLHLLRIFYAEGMVDKRTFLVWLIQQMSTCNLAQAGFVVRLADEYLADITASRALSHSFADSSLNKLQEVLSSGSAQSCLHNTAILLRTLLQRVCLTMSDAFVSPRMWAANSHLLYEILAADIPSHTSNQHIEQGKFAIKKELRDSLSTIEVRNKQLSFIGPSAQSSPQIGSSVSDVKLLNSISNKMNLQEIEFFTCALDDPRAFGAKLDVLFTWSITPLQYGDHRLFVAVALLDKWRSKQDERAHRRNLTSPHDFLQDQLFDWLDFSPAARAPENIDSVALLFENLIERDLFCYAQYFERLIARSEPGLSLMEAQGSHHRNFIRHIPLSNSNPTLVNQRRVFLYGVHARQVPEEINERQIRKEIRRALPTLFGAEDAATDSLPLDITSTCNTFVTCPRFEKLRTLKQWLLPILQSYVTSQTADPNCSSSLQIYATSIELMALAKAFDCIMNLIFALLQCANSIDIAMASVDYLYRYEDIWRCMGTMGKLVVQLDATQQALKAKGHRSRLIFDVLKLDGGRYLSPAALDRINYDIVHFTLALRPVDSHQESVPHVLPEIFRLESDFDSDFPSRLANSLWIKYRTSPEWAMIVWNNVLTSLQRIVDGDLTEETQSKYALQYGRFLRHIDQHLPTGLDEEISQWFDDPLWNQMVHSGPELWSTVSIVLIDLVANHALQITTILRGLVFPAWQQGASATEETCSKTSLTEYIEAMNKLCWSLLLPRSAGNGALDILRVQNIESRQQVVYSESFFPLLIAEIPTLISIESNGHLPESLRSKTSQLRHHLCQKEAFRRAVYRNLEITRDAFEQPLVLLNSDGNYCGSSFVAGLKEVLCPDEDMEADQWLPSTNQFSNPWKLAATSIHLQLVLKELGRALCHPETKDHAIPNLDKVSRELFHRRITSEESHYIAEVARGADNAVTEKLITSGLRRIRDILLCPESSGDALTDCLSWANEVLCAIVHLMGPSCDSVQPTPSMDPSLHEILLSAVHEKMVLFMQTMSSEYQHDTVLPGVVLLLRLLQFTLGFRGTWTAKAKDDGVALSVLLFRLTLKFCAGCDAEVSKYPQLLDTLYYLLDEIPHDTKVAFNPTRYYPEFSEGDISTDIAPEHRKQLLALSTQLTPNASTSDLASSTRDSRGDFLHNVSVVNRPWEWVEYLGEPALADAMDTTRGLLKNSGSLSLELFDTKLTGDTIIPKATEGLDGIPESSVRIFEDGLSAESSFRRDWRETRVSIFDNLTASGAGRKATAEQEFEVGKVMAAIGTHGPKPEKKVESTALGPQSPALASIGRITDSTLSELADSESASTSSSKTLPNTKRKADNEAEAVEPAPKRGKVKGGKAKRR